MKSLSANSSSQAVASGLSPMRACQLEGYARKQFEIINGQLYILNIANLLDRYTTYSYSYIEATKAVGMAA